MALRTHCRRGHPFAGANLYIRAKAGKTIRECKACRLLAMNRFKQTIPNEPTIKRVFAALRAGHTLANITCGRRGRTGAVPGLFIVLADRLKALSKQSPAMGLKIITLARANEAKAREDGGRNRRRAPAPALVRRSGTFAVDVIARATAHLPRADREDVMSMMFVALGEGRLKLADASARVGEFARAHRYRPRVFGDAFIRIDAPMWDGGPTLLESTEAERGLWT